MPVMAPWERSDDGAGVLVGLMVSELVGVGVALLVCGVELVVNVANRELGSKLKTLAVGFSEERELNTALRFTSPMDTSGLRPIAQHTLCWSVVVS